MERRIGTGGMGDVYRALDMTTNEPVAVKVLKAKARHVDRKRFEREIRILADLRHPGVVHYVDHGVTEDRRLFLVMEWLEGEDLAVRLARSQIGLRDAVEIVRRASQALAAVHARGIVHRDLKPSNIFIIRRRRGHAIKLIDFGMVKVPEPDDSFTQRGTFLGTPWFIAPEQAKGHHVDPRADVYSLGSVLFRMVTGRNAFETTHLIAYLGRLVLEDAPRASTLRKDVPPELDELLASLLRRDPSARPADAGELSRLLARLPELSNDPPRLKPSVPPPPMEQTLGGLMRGRMTSSPPPPGQGELLGSLESRVVAVMLAQLPGETLAAGAAHRLLAILGDRARFESLRDGQFVAALGLDKTRGDEAIRAARGALFLSKTVPGARITVAIGRAVAGRKGLAGEALEGAASQLQTLQTPGIRCDLPARSLLDGHFVLEEDAKGARLLREDIADNEPRPLLGKTTPIVGRTREVESLLAVFDEVQRTKQPRAVVVMGPAGCGKSRIRKEVVRRLRAELPGIDVLLARGDPTLSYRGVSDVGRALRARMGIRDGQTPERQAMKLVRYVSMRPGFPETGVDFLGEFVGITPLEDSQVLRSAREAPPIMAARIFHAIEALCRRDAEFAPQLLILEDFDKADANTVALVEWLLECKGLPLTVIALGRPAVDSRFPQLWEGRLVTRMVLGPLARAACVELVRAACPELEEGTLERLVDRAQGNPLFLEELVRHTGSGQASLPLSVQALIQTRVDGLGESQRQVLRAASVFGDVCWTEGLCALLDRDCESDLDGLVVDEILVRHNATRVHGHTQWSFRHSLVRDTVYASLLEGDLARFHRRAAEWLALAGAPDPAALALHAEAGKDRVQAVQLYGKASSLAFGKGQLDAALEFASRGVACADDPLSRAECLLQRAQILSWMGRFPEQREAANSAATLGSPGSDLWGEARRLAATAMREEGRTSEADALMVATLQESRVEGLSPGTRSRLLSEWARVLVELGRAKEGLTTAERALEEAERAGPQATNARLRALDARGLALNFLGDFSATIEAMDAVVALADQVGELLMATRSRVNLGFALTRVGCIEAGERSIERALEDARMLRMPAGEGFALHNLGRIRARQRRLDEAIALQQQAAAIGERIGHQRLTLLARIYEAMFLAWRRQADDVQRAVLLVELARADSLSYPFAEIEATLAQAQVDRARNDKEAALQRCTEALERLSSLGSMEEGEEGLHLTRLWVLLDLGRDDEADAAARDAYDCVRARCARLGSKTHREAYLSNIYECRKIIDVAADRLSLTRPLVSVYPPSIRSE
jgi:tetratricopeptide (TPR) repeat protein